MTAPVPLAKEDLEGAVALVVANYRAFVAGGSPSSDDPKAFTTWHAACRAALTHLEHLLKLLKAAGGGPEAIAPGEDLLSEALTDMGPPEAEE